MRFYKLLSECATLWTIVELCKFTRSFWTCLSGLRFVESEKDDIHVQLQLGPTASCYVLFLAFLTLNVLLHVALCGFHFQKYSYPSETGLQKSICV